MMLECAESEDLMLIMTLCLLYSVDTGHIYKEYNNIGLHLLFVVLYNVFCSID